MLIPPEETRKRDRRIEGLDAIRFICALIVVLDHNGLFPIFTGLDRSTGVGWFLAGAYRASVSGPAAVIVFFVISGLCIHYPYRNGRFPALVPFYTRRYLRIGIPLVGAIAFAQLVGMKYSLLENSVLWSIVCELIYYTLYPLLLLIRHKFGWRFLLPLAFAGSAAVILFDPAAKNYPAYGAKATWLLGLPCWLLGCRLAEQLDQARVVPSKYQIWTWRTACWLGSVFCLFLRFHGGIGYPYTLNVFAIVVFLWLAREARYASIHPHPGWLAWMGTWSYSIYLIHRPAQHAWNLLERPEYGPMADWLLSYTFVLLLAFAFFLAVEWPSHEFSRWISKRFVAPRMPSGSDIGPVGEYAAYRSAD